MTNIELKKHISGGELDAIFTKLYGADGIGIARERYIKTIDGFTQTFGEHDNLAIYSAPGRTEIGGNHTDHNLGKVLAGSVNLDVIGVVAQNDKNVINIKSEGHKADTIDLSKLLVVNEEKNRSASLIRGAAAKFNENGCKIGGFDAYTTSSVLKGSGLSSSAAFGVLIGTILNGEFNNQTIDAVTIAQVAQYAENVYFGKPCGLMDQMASSVGGVISIDFADISKPIINKVDFDFAKSGYALCIVDTGGSHADLTDEYASIPGEMKAVAGFFGKPVLREVAKADVLANAKTLREKFGDRAVLRSLHYLDDNEIVDAEKNALLENNFEEFKRLIIKSGNSSYKYLQNVYTSKAVDEQGLSLALYIAEQVLCGKGAYRVHGGGFGGTTQNFVPNEMVAEFKEKIEAVFGLGSCHVLQIRSIGGVKVV